MKKLASALIALLLAVQFCVPVFAGEVADGGSDSREVISEQGGVGEAPLSSQTPREDIIETQGVGNYNASMATPIAVNQAITTTTDYSYDWEWYVFTAPSTGSVSLVYQRHNNGGSTANIRMYSKAEYDANRYSAKEYFYRNVSTNAGSDEIGVQGVKGGQQYYVYVDNNVPYGGTPVNYSLTVKFNSNGNFYDNSGSVQKMTAGRLYTGALMDEITSSDRKVYSFKATKTGYITVDFRGQAAAGATSTKAKTGWNYKVFETRPNSTYSNYSDLYSFPLNKAKHNPARIGVRKGYTYYFVVTGYGTFRYGSNTYTLKLSNNKSNVWEINSENYRPAKATKLTLNKKLYGTFGNTYYTKSGVWIGGASIDWYQIKAPVSGTYRITFKNDTTTGGKAKMIVINGRSMADKFNKGSTIRGTSSQIPLRTKTMAAKKTSTASVTLNAGSTYYIAVYRLGKATVNNSSYQITVRR